MPNSLSHCQLFSRGLAALALVALGAGLSGCAGMSDTISPAFADPAKYDLYDCKQLETERKSLATRTAEVQGLMTKAETGVAGSVVAEMAYRNDYIALRDNRSWPKKPGRRTGARTRSRKSKRLRRSRRLLPRASVQRPAVQRIKLP